MSTLAADLFDYVRDLVYRRAAIVLDPGKEYLVEARLAGMVRDSGLADLRALLDRVRRDEAGPLGQSVVEAITTNETSFFRDGHPFEALRTHVLPELIRARAATRTLRIWCAAASTGQEPYSLAMVLRELLPPTLNPWKIELVATDLNTVVLERARLGWFRQFEVNRGLPPACMQHFHRSGDGWQLKDEIRQMVQFKPLNLLHSWSGLGRFDLVMMRNVLIYFDVPTRRALLQRVGEKLEPDGVLMLGSSETTTYVEDLFVPVRSGPTTLFRMRPPGSSAVRAAG